MCDVKKMRLFGLVCCLLLSPCCLPAQQEDSLAALRSFMQVCNIYRQLPLQVEISLQKTANPVTGKEDTVHGAISLFLQKEGAYIRYQNVEELINDSLVLVVNNNAQRMVLQANKQPVGSRIAEYAGMLPLDSSLLKMARLLTASALGKNKNGLQVIELKSRATIHGSGLPMQSITLQYNDNKEPVEIAQCKRSLLLLTAAQYQDLLKDSTRANKLVASPDGKHFFLRKEQVSIYHYGKIAHTEHIALPASITDRVYRDTAGEYTPVKAYKEFVLTENR